MPPSSASTSDRHDAVNSALKLAIEKKDDRLIKQAIENGGDGSILLNAGIERERLDWIKLALDHGGDPNALMFVALSRGTPTGEHLRDFFREFNDHSPPLRTSLTWLGVAIDHGADVNAVKKDSDGKDRAAIHWAYACFNPKIADLLIEHGAKVDTDSDAGTPLLRAVRAEEKKKIRYFLEKGADPTLVSGTDGKFPLKALQDCPNFLQGTKAKLLSLMMDHIPAPAPVPEPPPPAPQPDSGMTVTRDIEISHPIEFKMPEPPKPSKSFSL